MPSSSLRCRFFAAVPAYRHRVPWEGDILAAGTQTRHCAGKSGLLLRAPRHGDSLARDPFHPATARSRIRACRRRRATRHLLRAGQRPRSTPSRRSRNSRASPRPGTIWRHGMPAPSAMPLPPRPITARRCAPIRRTRCCSSARSSPLLVDGEIDEAVKLAERIVQTDKTQRVARLVLGVRALKQKQYQAARQHIAQSVRGPIADLTATLITAWTMQGTNEVKAAIESIDRLTGPEWYAIFKDLHAGLILDVAGNSKEAGKRLERVYKLDANALRAVEAYGRWASRNLGKDEALKIYEAFDKVLPQHPLIVEAMDEIKDGEKLAAAGRLAAGRRGRSPVRARDLARPPGRRGPRARLSAARDLSRAAPSARADVACRSLRVDSRSRRSRSRSTSAFLRIRRSGATPISRSPPTSMRSIAPTRRRRRSRS